LFGRTFYTVGLIEGGVAPNVIPADAWAEVMFRTVGDAGDVLSAVRLLEPLVNVEEILRVPPARLHTLPGMPSETFPFTTDIPLLNVAHADDEHLDLAEFEASIETYMRIVTALLSGPQ
jgi:acetylornithine deacetylase/succinyl-diaminopimelate desuccinylase-like protein